MKLHIRFSYFLPLVILLAALLSACRGAIDRPTNTAAHTQAAATASATTTATGTPTLTPSTGTPTPASTPTHTSRPPTPTATSTPIPELLPCPESPPQAESTQPEKLLYTNEDKVWLWDEASGKKTPVPLPADAVAPQISEDGRFVAFLKQGQAFDTPEKPVQSIPLWLLDRQTGQARQVTSFLTTKTRVLYPEAPQILLWMRWLPGAHWLLVQVYPVPWGEGMPQPTGDLFLVNGDTGAHQRILAGGAYEYYSLRPDGRQIAALDTAALSQDGTSNWDAVQKGTLHLIDIPPGGVVRHLPIRLPKNVWRLFAPTYSPDGTRMTLQVEGGLAVVDARTGSLQEIALENPCETNGCYWGGPMPVTWLPDGQSFYTLTSKNDFFNLRAETTLHLIRLGPILKTETVQVIHANPLTFFFSRDRQVLSYWNQPDLDEAETGWGNMNWVTLYLMDLQEFNPRRYTAEFVLRLIAWSPDSQRFLYIYSPFGGANPVTKRLALGNICQPPRGLPVPDGALIDQVQWLDNTRFLAWTTPADGIPTRYNAGLYLYSLAEDGEPIHMDDLVRDYDKPYGMQSQVVVLE